MATYYSKLGRERIAREAADRAERAAAKAVLAKAGKSTGNLPSVGSFVITNFNYTDEQVPLPVKEEVIEASWDCLLDSAWLNKDN